MVPACDWRDTIGTEGEGNGSKVFLIIFTWLSENGSTPCPSTKATVHAPEGTESIWLVCAVSFNVRGTLSLFFYNSTTPFFLHVDTRAVGKEGGIIGG